MCLLRTARRYSLASIHHGSCIARCASWRTIEGPSSLHFEGKVGPIVGCPDKSSLSSPYTHEFSRAPRFCAQANAVAAQALPASLRAPAVVAAKAEPGSTTARCSHRRGRAQAAAAPAPSAATRRVGAPQAAGIVCRRRCGRSRAAAAPVRNVARRHWPPTRAYSPPHQGASAARRQQQPR